MTFTWREHADALDEYRAAAQWYEAKRPGWGDVFMDAVDLAIESILDPSINWGSTVIGRGPRRYTPAVSPASRSTSSTFESTTRSTSSRTHTRDAVRAIGHSD